MRECDFCGTPAPDDNATTCVLCGSPLSPATAEPTGPLPVGEPFDPGATIASPRAFGRHSPFEPGPAPLRRVPAAFDPPPAPPPVEVSSQPVEIEEELPAEPALPPPPVEAEAGAPPVATGPVDGGAPAELAALVSSQPAEPEPEPEPAAPPAIAEEPAAPEEAISTLRAPLRSFEPAPVIVVEAEVGSPAAEPEPAEAEPPAAEPPAAEPPAVSAVVEAPADPPPVADDAPAEPAAAEAPESAAVEVESRAEAARVARALAVDFLGRVACPQCGQRNGASKTHCMQCGARLDAPPQDPSPSSEPGREATPTVSPGPPEPPDLPASDLTGDTSAVPAASAGAAAAQSAAAGDAAAQSAARGDAPAQSATAGDSTGQSASAGDAAGQSAAAGDAAAQSAARGDAAAQSAAAGDAAAQSAAAGDSTGQSAAMGDTAARGAAAVDDAATIVSMPTPTGPEPAFPGSERTVVFGEPVAIECTVCGTTNDTVSAFCVRCGARLGGEASGPEAAASAFAAAGPSMRGFDPADAPTIVPEPRDPAGPQSRRGMASFPEVRCPSCRTLNDAAGVFCVSCGASLRGGPGAPADVLSAGTIVPTPQPPPPSRLTPAAVPRACPSCGVANDPGTRFCISCGNSMTRDAFAAQRPAEPPPPPMAPRDPFARSGAAFPPPLPTPPPPPPMRANNPPPAPRDAFARNAPPPMPPSPPPYSPPQNVPGSFAPPGQQDGGSGKMSALVIVGIVAGAAVGAGIALALMTVFDVSPF